MDSRVPPACPRCERAWRRYTVARDLLELLCGYWVRFQWPHPTILRRVRDFLDHRDP